MLPVAVSPVAVTLLGVKQPLRASVQNRWGQETSVNEPEDGNHKLETASVNTSEKASATQKGFKYSLRQAVSTVKSWFSFNKPLQTLNDRWSRLDAKLRYLGVGATEVVEHFVFKPQQVEEAVNLKRSPKEVARLVAGHNAVRYRMLENVLAGVNLGTAPYANQRSSAQPAGVLWLDGTQTNQKTAFINNLADLAFKPEQVKTLDVSQFETADAMKAAVNSLFSNEPTESNPAFKMLVLNHLLGGSKAPDTEKLEFARWLRDTLVNPNFEVNAKTQGWHLKDTLLVVNMPELSNKDVKNPEALQGSLPASEALFHLKDELLMRRGFLQATPFNKVLSFYTPEERLNVERVAGALAQLVGA